MDTLNVTLTVFSNCLVATLPQEATLDVLADLRRNMLLELDERARRAVVFDLTGVQVLEAAEFDHLAQSGRMAQLLGAKPCLVGLRPSVVAYLVAVDVNFSDLLVARNLQTALDQIEAST